MADRWVVVHGGTQALLAGTPSLEWFSDEAAAQGRCDELFRAGDSPGILRIPMEDGLSGEAVSEHRARARDLAGRLAYDGMLPPGWKDLLGP
jgi:hypothetical protein